MERVNPFSGLFPQRPIMPKTNPRFEAATAAASTSPVAPVLLPTGFLRQPQVLRLVPISKSTLWRRIQAKTFPQPVKLSVRVTAWRAEDIYGWIAQQG
jgi:predicted DNA-binding transcriptional regulator AlpA